MGTLKNSFPLMKFLLSLFFILTTKANSINNIQSHTIQIASLLPASSICTIPSNAKDSDKTRSRMKVFHQHGPCSRLDQDKNATSTTTPSLSEVLSLDQSRVDSIKARHHNSNSNKDQITERKASLPVKSGRPLGTGNYIATVGLGTPRKTLSLVFDTASDLTWTQCQPCSRFCHPQQDPIFNPSASSSYSNISCDSAQCSQLSSATGNSPGCSSGTTCIYLLAYGDRSFTVGFLSKDKITISPTDVFPNFVFGCGQNNQGLFGNAAGLIGLGKGPLSLISQTSSKYGKFFSYCLPTSSSVGHLTFGKNGAPNNAKFTPFANSRIESFYYIDIIGISVGGHQLPISGSVFKAGGSIIDSGTVITRLPPAAYSTMSSVFRQGMTKYKKAPAFSLLDTCYDFGNLTTVSMPTIAFTFGGNVRVDLEPLGILIAVSSSSACLAFAGNSDAGDVTILGNTQQKTMEVAYDVAGGKLGFIPNGCT